MPVEELTVDLGAAAPLTIPYVEVEGRAGDGPHLTVIAGVHGTEYTSIAAARELAATVDAESLHGRLTVVPVVNLPAFWARSPFVVPLDGKNLNRSFPGDAAGTASERIAAAVTERFIKGSDYFLDLHAGDLPEALEPFALYDESPVSEQARALALAYGLGHVVRQAAAGRTVGGSTSAVAADLGIPAITAESGQCGILDRAAVERHLRGLRNILCHLGMTGEPATQFPAPAEHEGWLWLSTEAEGWWEPAVQTGEDVPAGALIGTVAPVLGGAPTEIRAPQAGVPLFITSSPAVVAGGLLMGLALT
ncbi:M14 family metallopeptidase [Nocardioides sp. LHG3406-4]|uniref:M14 family metallopeptidase n=1 Tax=Nocardioides sp. LHG3406-4 TaxID=2804575 RepID=UPI003CF499AF